MSVVWIAVCSFAMVFMVGRAGCSMTIDSFVMGLILVAIGTSVPVRPTSFVNDFNLPRSDFWQAFNMELGCVMKAHFKENCLPQIAHYPDSCIELPPITPQNDVRVLRGIWLKIPPITTLILHLFGVKIRHGYNQPPPPLTPFFIVAPLTSTSTTWVGKLLLFCWQDALSSVIVARDGFGDMAVSNAIGSNVFDINLGIGLPSVIRILADKGATIFLIEEEHLHVSHILPPPFMVFVRSCKNWTYHHKFHWYRTLELVNWVLELFSSYYLNTLRKWTLFTYTRSRKKTWKNPPNFR